MNAVNPTRSESSQEAEKYVLGLVGKLAARPNTDRLYIKMDGIDIFKMKNGAPARSRILNEKPCSKPWKPLQPLGGI